MTISKALVVAEPWISLILNGEKTWEMRSTGTTHRGWFGLIRKGSGAVCGVAQLVESGAPLNRSEMIHFFNEHQIPLDMIHEGRVEKWTTPWKLADVRKLSPPVSYHHSRGAVRWVNLDRAASAAISRQLESASTEPVPPTLPARARSTATPSPTQTSARSANRTECSEDAYILGEVEVTAANIRHNHFYLSSIFDRFPDDVMGGSNKNSPAERNIEIDWGGAEPVSTDIDSKKKFFRARSWVGDFYEQTGAKPGDMVRIEETAPYRYRVSLHTPK